MSALPLFEDPYLRAQWGAEFDAFEASPASAALLSRLRAWASRDLLSERASETAFIQRFFVETWGYHLQGHDATYNCRPQYELAGAGQGGGMGFADLALGHFGGDAVPQVLCEFKDIRSGLDVRHLYDKPQTEWIAAQWRHDLRDQNVTEAFDAKKLLKPLLTQRTTTEEPLRQRILHLDQTIAHKEFTLNTIIFSLYGLSSPEIDMVKMG